MNDFFYYLEKVQEKYSYEERVHLDWSVPKGFFDIGLYKGAETLTKIADKAGLEKIANYADNVRFNAGSRLDKFGKEYTHIFQMFIYNTPIYFDDIQKVVKFVNDYGAASISIADNKKYSFVTEQTELSFVTEQIKLKSKQIILNMIKELEMISKKFYHRPLTDVHKKEIEKSKTKTLLLVSPKKEYDKFKLILE